MEKWSEVFAGKIPDDSMYQVNLVNGEENGLVIELNGNEHKVCLIFGWVFAIRMLDEGLIQSNLYSKNEINRFCANNFKNVIYQVAGGEFETQIKKISGGYWEVLELCEARHYLIFTTNFCIDIIAQCEPEIKVIY